jgi:nucleoside-diphosphate-sugar epimerase
MTRLLLTGGTGFIGGRVAPLLVERGYEVHAVGRTPPIDNRIKFHPADMLNSEATRAVVADVRATHLLHLAWDVTPGHYRQAAGNLDWVGASLHLVRAFQAAGGERAVFAGTCAEYQWGAPRFFETETPCVPATLYGVAKDALRRLLDAYSASSDVSVASGRLFFPYGPGEKSGRLVSGAVQTLLAGNSFPATHGRQERDFLHVDDVAGAFVALLECNVRGPVNVGSGKAVPVRTVLDMIGQITGNAQCLRLGEISLAETEPAIIEADTTRLTEEVHFSPRYDLAEGLADAVAWWKSRNGQIC